MTREQRKIEVLKELIDKYQSFTKWVLRHDSDIAKSQRGFDHLMEIDKIEKQIRSLESFPDEDSQYRERTASAEQILKDNLSDYYWVIIENQTTLPDHEKTLKKWIIEAMKEYASQYAHSAPESKANDKATAEAFPSKSMACDECDKGESNYDEPEMMQSKMLNRKEYAKAAYVNGFLNCYDWLSRRLFGNFKYSQFTPAAKETAEETKESQISFRDLVLSERDKGNVVFLTTEGPEVMPLDDIIQQPVDGLLYDLNRNESVVLTFIKDPKWINDYAVAQVIRELKRRLEQYTSQSPDQEKIPEKSAEKITNKNIMTKDEFITERTRIISNMLDNPDKYGIYPTTKCFNELDTLFDEITAQQFKGQEKVTDDQDDFDKINCLIGYLEMWENSSIPIIAPTDLKSIIDEANEWMRDKLSPESKSCTNCGKVHSISAEECYCKTGKAT